jgi:hypothetical protein
MHWALRLARGHNQFGEQRSAKSERARPLILPESEVELAYFRIRCSLVSFFLQAQTASDSVILGL